MRRLCLAVAPIMLAGILAGCGEDQPNASTKPEEMKPDFGTNAGDMMKKANSGMDPSKAKAGGAGSPGGMMPKMPGMPK